MPRGTIMLHYLLQGSDEPQPRGTAAGVGVQHRSCRQPVALRPRVEPISDALYEAVVDACRLDVEVSHQHVACNSGSGFTANRSSCLAARALNEVEVADQHISWPQLRRPQRRPHGKYVQRLKGSPPHSPGNPQRRLARASSRGSRG